MRRLNVRQTQIRECIEKSMFAVDTLPVSPPLEQGELLLLQLTKDETRELGKLGSRIEFALVFDYSIQDVRGDVSRLHWPYAGKIWKHIIFGSKTIPTVPFSLEDLPLSKDYGGQTNPRYILPRDEELIMPFILGELRGLELRDRFGPLLVKETVANYDVAVRKKEPKTFVVPAHEEFCRDPWLAETLKSLYDHRCQVCGMNFQVKYSEPFAETHHIRALAKGGLDIGENVIVLCPNHHRIIHKTTAEFDHDKLLYKYPNGLEERLILPDHFQTVSAWG